MITENAYAKINLFLDVTGKRNDGYHFIRSFMQSVSLCDEVLVDFQPGDATIIRLFSNGKTSMPMDEKNIAWKAAKAYLEAIHKKGTVTICIEKNIPMEAGLAGGSTDAAAVFRALNRINNQALTQNELEKLGATIGADVPFCIRGGGCIVEGIGEVLTSTEPMPGGYLVISKVMEGVKTKDAYHVLDERYDDFHNGSTMGEQPLNEIVTAFRHQHYSLAENNFYNIFESVIVPNRPIITEMKNIMKECGASTAMMSGSGPSVFGIFSKKENAICAQKMLQEIGADAFMAIPVQHN